MRVKIGRAATGSVDGIDLRKFVVGITYDVGTSLGNYLMAEGIGAPVHDQQPAVILPIDHPIAGRLRPATPRAEAADREPRKKS